MEAEKNRKEFIRIRGANENNLKHLSVDIPRNKLVVLTGLSGSGKSSLAFDTIYAEGQRRYMESLSSTRDNFWDRWKNQMWRVLKGCRQRFPLTRNPPTGIPGLRWELSRRSMIIFVCSMRGLESPTVPSAEKRSRSRP